MFLWNVDTERLQICFGVHEVGRFGKRNVLLHSSLTRHFVFEERLSLDEKDQKTKL